MGMALGRPSATAGLATAFACRGCPASAATSVLEASLASFPTANPATSASATGIALCRCTCGWVQKVLAEGLVPANGYVVSSQDLAVRSRALAERANDIQNTGLTGAYEKFFKNLEGKLAQAQGIVNARNATASAVTLLVELTEDLRYQRLFSDPETWAHCY